MKKKTITIFSLFCFQLGFTQSLKEFDAMGFSSHDHPFVAVKLAGKSHLYMPGADLLVDKIDSSTGNMMCVIKDGVYGVVHSNGRLLAAFEYDDIELKDEYQGQWYKGIPYDYEFVITKKQGKYGIIDVEGRVVSQPQYQAVEVINKDLIGVQQEGKWGWISAKNGKLLQDPIYDRVSKSYLIKEAVTIYKGENEGLAKADGTIIIPPQYPFLRNLFTHSASYIEYSENGRYGIINSAGKTEVPAQFEALESLGNVDLIKVKEGDQFGAIDLQGKWVLPAHYTRIDNFVKGLSIVEQGARLGAVDAKGKQMLPTQYDDIEFQNVAGQRVYAENAAVSPPMAYGAKPTKGLLEQRAEEAKIAALPYYIVVKKENKVGIFDWASQPIVPIQNYTAAEIFYANKTAYFKVFIDSLYGLFDVHGKELLPIKYHYPSGQYDDSFHYDRRKEDTLNDRFIPMYEGQKIGLFDLALKKFIIPMADQEIKWKKDRYLQVRRKTNRNTYSMETALYDSKGECVSAYNGSINSYYLLTDSLLLLEGEERVLKVVDLSGKTVYEKPNWRNNMLLGSYDLPLNKNLETAPFESGLFKVGADEDNLFIDKKGREKRFEGYDIVGSFYKNRAFVLKKKDNHDLYGMIDTAGKEVIPTELDRVEEVHDNPDILMVQKGRLYGLMTWEGVFLLPLEYEFISINGSKKYMEITKNGKKGLAEKDGHIVVPVIYDELSVNYNGEEETWPLLVKEGEWYKLINKEGKPYPARAKRKVSY